MTTNRSIWLFSLCIFFVISFGEIRDVQAAQPRFVFISHAPDSDKWWNIIQNALKHAGEDFNVVVDYKNPATGDLQDMVRIINESSKQNYQGMIVTIADYELLKEPLQRVVDIKKMPLITVNSGTQKKSEAIGALLHIGQPELLAGERAGEKARRASIHSFVCLTHDVTNSSSQERCNGFARGLGPDAKMVMLELDGDSVAMQAKISQYLTAHADTEAMLALGTTSAHAALEAIKSSKVRPYFATFDLSGPISDRASALEHHKGVRPSMFMRKSSSQAAPLRRRRRLVFFFPGGASRMMLRTIFRSSERFCGALSLRSVFPSSPKLTSSTQ